nr:LD-carboxypeptidase [Eubacterium sp.]
MRYAEFLKDGGTIGFIAPSFGCAIEPYISRFDNAIKEFNKRGYKTWLGPNCFEDKGIGISNEPSLCGKELNSVMVDSDSQYEESDCIITCGGGELMCEVVPFINFEKIRESRPKWYMGYSDNTNFTFLSATLADTAAIYGPCAPTFGRVPWHESVEDGLKLISGKKTSVSGYGMWEKNEFAQDENAQNENAQNENAQNEDDRNKNDQNEDGWNEANQSEKEIDPLAPYNISEKSLYYYYLPDKKDLVSGDNYSEKADGSSYKDGVRLEGRLLGGCLDILTLLVGTKYDKVDEFIDRYSGDGIIWFLEACDLDMLSMRRAFWQLKEAGWFRNARGFLIGRPRVFGQDIFGVNQYNAVTDIIGELGQPIIMDLDIGHLPPMMPIICGSKAHVSAIGN